MTGTGAQAPSEPALVQAAAFLRRGDLKTAAALIQQVLARRPDHPAALQLAGGLALQSGRTEVAIGLLSRAAMLDSQNADTLSNLALALTRAGRRDEAVRQLKRAIELKPGLVAAHINLAVTLVELGEFTEAEAAARRAIALAPQSADARQALGLALEAQDRFEDAFAAHREAVALAPQRGSMHGELASTLLAFGDFEGAKTALAEAIRLEPLEGKWRQRLTGLRRDDGDIAQYRELLGQVREPAQRAPLFFGLARALDASGHYFEAMDAYIEANRIRRAQVPYSAEDAKALFADLESAFDERLVERLAGSGDPAEGPIFILGMPRSGTSMVEQMLANHPKVFGGGELLWLRSLIAEMGGGGPKNHAEVARTLTGRKLAALGSAYLERLHAISGDKPFVTDKMPGNYLLLGYIALALPGARIIHMRRDPIDNCLSLFRNDFGSPIAYASDLAELGQYYGFYRRLLAHWRVVLPGRIHDLDYEALVADPEGQLRPLLQYCGLDWSDACLDFQNNKRAVRTVSAVQLREPIHARSIGMAARYGEKIAPLVAALAEG